MYQTNEQFDSTMASRRGRLQAREARAAYEADEFDLEASGNPQAWLSRRPDYYNPATVEALETLPATQKDTFEMSRWNLIFDMDLSACMMQKNPLSLYIDMPPDDWSWCADPL
jgi:hypothetical protein